MLELMINTPPRDLDKDRAVPVVGICHRVRLFGECLERTLAVHDTIACRLLDPAEVLRGSVDAGPLTLLLLDVAIAPGELAGVIARLRQLSPHLRLLLLVPESSTNRLVDLTQWGSQGCVRENGSLDELCLALRQILAGRNYFASELANALFEQLNGCDARQPWANCIDEIQLTTREREVLRLIAWEDLGNKQIARRLHVSLYTVKNHVHSIIEKLGVSDRHDAARQAKRRNLIGQGLVGPAIGASVVSSVGAALRG
jgi:DNA-binding NarL/FixJ family response regulator